MSTLMLEKKRYVPVEAVASPEKLYFATVPLLQSPKLSSPGMCHLCGAGFWVWIALVGQCM